MDEKLYSITLEDGTVLNNLRLNGNNFISRTPIEESVFDGNLGTVTFSDGTHEDVHHDMQLVRFSEDDVPGEYWFVLIDIPESELRYAKLRSDIDYVSMMTDLEL